LKIVTASSDGACLVGSTAFASAKNFKSREEAIIQKGTLELKTLQAGACLHSATTFLFVIQPCEATTVFNRIKEKPRALSVYLDCTLTNYQEPATQRLLTDAVKAARNSRHAASSLNRLPP